jgi:hypothetical protein
LLPILLPFVFPSAVAEIERLPDRTDGRSFAAASKAHHLDDPVVRKRASFPMQARYSLLDVAIT